MNLNLRNAFRNSSYKSVAIVVISYLFCTSLWSPSASVHAQDQAAGWLEGTVVNQAGEAPKKGGSMNIELKVLGPTRVKGDMDRSLGGFYSFRDLKPGIYEVFVEASSRYEDNKPYRPQHIHGVLVRPGTRTVLKIVVHEGTELEDVGQPTEVTEKVIVISQELQRLQQQIDELKKKQ